MSSSSYLPSCEALTLLSHFCPTASPHVSGPLSRFISSLLWSLVHFYLRRLLPLFFCYPPLTLPSLPSFFLSLSLVFILRGVPDPIHSSLFKTVDPLSTITLHAPLSLTSRACVFQPLSYLPPVLFYPLSLSLARLPLLSRSNLSPEGSDWQASGGLVWGTFWLVVREMKRIKSPGPAPTALQKMIHCNLSWSRCKENIHIKHVWSHFFELSSFYRFSFGRMSGNWDDQHLTTIAQQKPVRNKEGNHEMPKWNGLMAHESRMFTQTVFYNKLVIKHYI